MQSIMNELKGDSSFLFQNVDIDATGVDFFNDEIMKACLKTTVEAIPTFEEFYNTSNF